MLLRYCLDQITSGIMLIVVYVCVSRQEAATAYNKGLALAASNRRSNLIAPSTYSNLISSDLEIGYHVM